MPSLLDPDYQFGTSPLPGASSGVPTDLLGLSSLQVMPQDQNTDLGAGLAQTYQAVTDYIARQREQSRQMGLLDPDTGWPTEAGAKDAAQQTAMSLLMGTTAPGIRAYHGSPHSFEAFDTSKIGTGEGNQAYGHGLYFAEGEGVARSYRDALAPDAWPRGSPESHAKYALDLMGGDLEQAKAMLANQALSAREVGAASSDVTALEAAHKIMTDEPRRITGSMYEVNIGADPEHFLHWDKPLSEQHPVVQQALAKVHAEDPEAWQRIVASNPKGEALYESGGIRPSTQAQALRDAGIPGIKYLDQGSRAAGEGSHNYVVFSNDVISILRKYGLAGLMLGAGGVASQQRGSEQ